jgi:hypothetical protein
MTNGFEINSSGPDINKTTAYTYNASGQIGTLTATNATTGDQVTQSETGKSETGNLKRGQARESLEFRL